MADDRVKHARTQWGEEGGEYCEMLVTLSVPVGALLAHGRLCVTGTTGRIQTRESAKAYALEYWEGFFEDDDEEFGRFLARNSSAGISSKKEAAEHILACDGELHGIDIFKEGEDADGNAVVYLHEGGGCMHDEFERWWPGTKRFTKYHGNDLKAGCAHQERKGWGRGHTLHVSINEDRASGHWVLVTKNGGPVGGGHVTKRMVTAIERDQVISLHERRAQWLWDAIFNLRMSALGKKDASLYWFLKANTQPPWTDEGVKVVRTIIDQESDFIAFLGYERWKEQRFAKPKPEMANQFGSLRLVKQIGDALLEEMEVSIPAASSGEYSFEYEDCLRAPCPTCGYRYGTAHKMQELPLHVVSWALDREVGSHERQGAE